MTTHAQRWRRAALAAACVVSAGTANAIEYPLQYNPYGDYEKLVVAGYAIVGKTIVGNCSYTRITSGSGRDPRSSYTPIPQTCTWDLYGNLVSTIPGAPTVPPVIKVRGTETIYAHIGGSIYTGTDSAYATGGFVFTYGAHEQWLTSNAYMVQPLQTPTTPYTFIATLLSNGDVPLNVSKVTATTLLAGAKATITSTTCIGKILGGATCDVGISYSDVGITSPTGLAYDTLTIHAVSNAGEVNDFIQRYTDEVPIPVDDGGS
jgi:hypothetical protein